MHVLDFLYEIFIILSFLWVLQIAFLECGKHSGLEKPWSDNVTCALKVLCPEKQDSRMQQVQIVKPTELKDQCPVQVENIISEHDLLFLDHYTYVSQKSVSSISWEHHSGGKVASRC